MGRTILAIILSIILEKHRITIQLCDSDDCAIKTENSLFYCN